MKRFSWAYIAIAITALASLICARWFNEVDWVREISTGAFSGAVIGLIILIYEQQKEDRRETVQWERDRKLAKRIRDDANLESDIRTLADYALLTYQPILTEIPTVRTVKYSELKLNLRLHNSAMNKFVTRTKTEPIQTKYKAFIETLDSTMKRLDALRGSSKEFVFARNEDGPKLLMSFDLVVNEIEHALEGPLAE